MKVFGGPHSVLGQVLQVKSVLSAVLRLLHFAKARERAHPDRNAQQLARDGVLSKLGVTRHTLRELDNIEAPELCHRGYVASTADYTSIGAGIVGAPANGRERRFQPLESFAQAIQVVGIRIGNDVEILGSTYESVCSDGNSADYDELDTGLVQGLEQRAKVEIPQRTLAAPRMALSCLQSAWTRARRSLIGTLRSASRRSARARRSSPMSPLNVLAATRASLAALLLSFVVVSSSHAAYDPVGSGTTKLTLDKRFAAFLGKDKIKLTAAAGATRRGRALLLPVTGGNLDTTIGKGEIDQGGTIIFKGARKKVPLKKIVLRTKATPLIAKVGGSQLKVATSRELSSRREGFGTAFAAKRLKLTAKVATRLNKKLRPEVPFQEGQLLGTVSSEAQPHLTTILAQGKATLVFDEAFFTKMDKHFVSINPIFPAEHQKAVFTLPIIGGGRLAPNGSEGELRTGGEIEFLQLGAGQVFWHEQWLGMAERLDSAEVDVEPTPTFPGKLGRLGVLQAAPFSVSSDPARRTISAQGIQLTLTAQTAQTFDEAFAAGKEDFKAGELLGTLSFSAQGQ
jgi:hypothetical protein